MAKPPRKIPRKASPEASGPDANPLPASLATLPVEPGYSDPGMMTVNPRSDALSEAPADRPSVIVSRPLPRERQLSEARTADWVRQQSSEAGPSPLAGTYSSERPSHPVYINPESANHLKLQPGTAEGFRYDKRKKTYVEMLGGMVMVSKTAEGWRQTHAGESTPTGQRVAQIPGTKLWREIDAPQQGHPVEINPLPTEATDAVPGPSQRRRLDEQTHVATGASTLIEHLLAQPSGALDLSARQWRNWGKAAKPGSGESIEIDGQYFRIVAQGVSDTTELVYLQHPGFSPDRYDAFETMLRHEPSRQPKWALKRQGQWKVVDNAPPFEMSTTQYVSAAYNYLSEQSTSNLARAVFDRVSLPQGINAHGLSAMALTFRHWLDRVNNEPPLHSLSDPLVMLPILPTPPGHLAGGGLLTLPAYNSAVLQRLDFDPQRFPQEWAHYAAAPTPGNLRGLLVTLLQHNGYSINPSTRRLSEGALFFHRPGVAAVFVLKLPRIAGNQVPRTTPAGTELTDPTYLTRLSVPQKQLLESQLAHTEVIYLVGGIQHLSADNPTLFIVREG
ncbi:hypothetical protein [Pseudomonas sp. AKS31]|uniref:hypothetical protein n=1 Tax=Pseudomonas sp. AKS31 TaxID=2949091 RepID=UPI00202A0F10|nr:hypothetical protein [Pseudomonas sp. AKS31]MCL9799432.1 hypothetical protein [Pseudomonas sp. AKS31]